MSTKAHANLGVHDDGKFERTAILMRKGTTTSLDVLREDGTLLCRLNISEFGSDTMYEGNVDVIINPVTQTARFGAWQNGVRVVDKETVAITAHSVAINKRT